MRTFLIILWSVLALLAGISCIWIEPFICKLIVLCFSCLNAPTAIALLVMDIADRRARKKENELQLQENTDLSSQEEEG